MGVNSQVYVASKDVFVSGVNSGYEHLYIVYDEDGNLGTLNDQRVIRGGSQTAQIGIGTDLLLEVGVLIQNSADVYGVSETPFLRGMTQISASGMTADQLWLAMKDFAISLGTVHSGIFYAGGGNSYDTGLDYDVALSASSDGFNSNSTVASILSQFGIRLADTLPLNPETPSNPSDKISLSEIPGYHNQYGGTGDNVFIIESAANHIDGRGGSDTANFTNVFTGLTIDLSKEEFSGLLVDGEIKNIEHVIGTNYADTIIGDVGGNTLNGGSGVDTIRGGLGNDTILGGIGNDILNGEGGIDTVNGEAGNDTIIYRLSDHSVILSGNEVLNGGADTDTLRIELRSSELTMALRNELVQLYNDMVVNPPMSGSSYSFTNLNLQVSNFESMEVWVDGEKISLLQQISDVRFHLADDYNEYYPDQLPGTILGNSYEIAFGSKPILSFGEMEFEEGTFSTTAGGTISIDSYGTFLYTGPSANYVGQDTYTYTVFDAAGRSSTGTVYFTTGIRDDVSGSSYSASPGVPIHNPSGVLTSVSGSNYDDHISLFNPDAAYVVGYGNDGRDVISAVAGSGDVYGGNGNDLLEVLTNFSAYTNNFMLDGGAGDDAFWINAYFSYEYWGANHPIGYEGNSTEIYGGDGNDRAAIYNSAADFVDMGNGDDRIDIALTDSSYTGSFGVDGLDGGAGIDVLAVNKGFDVNLATGALVYSTNTGTTNTISNVENVIGSVDNDKIYGSFVDNKLEGGDGNDELYGAAGNDLLYGDNGDDTYVIKTGEGVDQIFDTSGTDKIKFGAGITAGTLTYFSEGDDLLIKHNGTTLVRLVDHLYNANNIETIQFSDNSTLSLKDVFIHTLKGTDGADTITASKGAIQDVINGNGGNDAIYAYAGNDKVNGGAGNDSVYAHEGNDTAVYVYGENIGATDLYYGGTGSDTLELHFKLSDMTQDINDDLAAYYAYISNPSNINLNSAIGAEYAFSEFDLTAGRFETVKVFVDGYERDASNVGHIIYGTAGDDGNIEGTSGNDIIYGLGGINAYAAGDGDDIIIGGSDIDEIYAGNGNDVLIAKGGFNYLQGNAGADTFVFDAETAFDDTDTVTDFNPSEDDKLDISDLLIDYVAGTSDINDYLSYDETNPWFTKLIVDRDGAGTVHTGYEVLGFYTGGNPSATIDDLLANGNLIV